MLHPQYLLSISFVLLNSDIEMTKTKTSPQTYLGRKCLSWQAPTFMFAVGLDLYRHSFYQHQYILQNNIFRGDSLSSSYFFTHSLTH